jgi:hypothetical protein
LKALNPRQEQILLVLRKFDFMTRDQLRKYCRLGTIRNANRELLKLADYLNNVRDGYQSIYYLNKEGRAYVDCDKVRKKGGHVTHTVMRNDFWLYIGCPYDWQNEIKISDGKTTIVCDAMFKRDQLQHFLEVDHKKSMKENRLKIDKYIELHKNGLIAQSLGHFPAVVWVTTTELRRKQLTDACKVLPGARIYTMTDII